MADQPSHAQASDELADLRRRLARCEERAAAAERRCWQQERLLSAAHRVASTLDPTEVLTRICAEARSILDAFGCAVYVLDPDRRLLLPVAAMEPPVERQVLATPLDLDRSLTGQAVLAGRGMIFNGAYCHPLGQTIPGTPEVPDERVIVAPFAAGDDTFGAICLSRTGQDFTRGDLAVVELLAEQAAMALRNARLHSTLQAEVEERKRAEEALRASEERLRTLFHRVPVALYRTSPDGRLVDVNPALLDLLGLPDRESALGCRATDFFPHHEREVERAALATRGTVAGYPLRLRRSDGTVIAVEDTARAVYDGEGALLYYEGSLRDVTQELEARAEREGLIARLQEALARARTLSGLLPICAWCGKVRDDEGYWQRLERYIAEHSLAEFTHGICPECAARMGADAAPSRPEQD
jgi:PAS domain S-box-containing protein